MTKAEYEEYKDAVERGLKGLTAASSGCAHSHCSDCECDAKDGDECHMGEPWFSWRACEVCGSTLGGDRQAVHALDANNEMVHMNACVDCVYFIEYGCLDDTTMAEIGE